MPAEDGNDEPPLGARAWISIALLGLLVALLIAPVVSAAAAALVVAGLMIAAGCISPVAALRSVHWPVLVTIAAAFAIGQALVTTGVAQAVVGLTFGPLSAWGPLAALAGIYLATVALTELVTNTAAAALMFPFALEAAALLGVDARPFMFALALAASASFATPIGYQTNIMVADAGGGRFIDFIRVGLPLNFLLAAVAVALIPRVWPF